MTGPLSTLPPEPTWSHRGGAQPASQWQLWLLLHNWWENTMPLLKLPCIVYIHYPSVRRERMIKVLGWYVDTGSFPFTVLMCTSFWWHFITFTCMKCQMYEFYEFHNSGQAAIILRPVTFLTCTETHPVSMALGTALIGFEERCIAAFSIKANLMRDEGVCGEKWRNKSEKQVFHPASLLTGKRHKNISEVETQVFTTVKLQHYICASLTESTPHLVPVMTRPGSRVSPCTSSSPCPALYTCVPIHRIFLLPTLTMVSMRTALFSIGLEAEDKHWIFPHWASLTDKKGIITLMEIEGKKIPNMKPWKHFPCTDGSKWS